MENWEDDTDALLMQLPATGCVFRKTWYADGPDRDDLGARPRGSDHGPQPQDHAAHHREDQGRFPARDHRQAAARLLPGHRLALPKKPDGSEEKDGTRLLLEQHCLWDFDDDGLPEPYIVTVDHQTRLVLRIEPNFGPSDIEWRDESRRPRSIRRRDFYVKYGMFPHPAASSTTSGWGIC
jgi:chaperonin GroES